MDLSICMMVKDEEKNLDRCLTSIQALMDEVESELIIVDTGSTDNTVEIAKKYTEKIYFHRWNNNFSEMRNISIGYAKGDWIFIYDADEEMTDATEMIKFIKDKKENSKYNTVNILERNYLVNGDDKVTGMSSTLRLFRNGTIRYEGAVHNQCMYKNPITNLNVLINHYGYISNDKELMEKKFKRTSAILKRELGKNPNNIYYLYQLATSYDMHLDYEEALVEVKKAYDLIKNDNIKMNDYKFVLYRYAAIEVNLKNWLEVEKICSEGIKIANDYIDLYFYLAQAQVFLEKYEYSLKNYNIYFDLVKNYDKLTIKNDPAIVMYSINNIDQALNNTGVCYYKLKKYEDAFNLAIMIKNEKVINESMSLLIETGFKTGKIMEMYKYYKEYIISNETLKNLFHIKLEDRLKENKEHKKDCAEWFSQDTDEYAILNKLRAEYYEKDIIKFKEFIEENINSIDWNNQYYYFGDIIYYILYTKYPFKDIIGRMSELKISEYLEYCNAQYNDLFELIKNYINSSISSDTYNQNINEIYNNKSDDENSTASDFNDIKKNKVLTRCLILLDKNLSPAEYNQYFRMYLINGIKYIEILYSNFSIENELIYEIKGNEEAFLIYMKKAMYYKESSKKEYVSYLRKALKIYPRMKDCIEILLDELKQENENDEFNILTGQLKKNIVFLINDGNLEEAKLIISQYEQLVKDDLDILLYKSQIALKEKENI